MAFCSRHLATLLAVTISLLATAAVFYLGLFRPAFNPDSWSLLEYADSVFVDFFRIHTLRQYVTHSPYGNSFPPLWPVLIACVRSLGLDLGIYTLYALSAAVHVGLLAGLVALAGRLGQPGWIGCVAYCCLLTYKPYLNDDALAGGTLPLALTLFIAGLLQLFGGEPSLRRALFAGVALGLACLTRFDLFPAAFLVGLAVARPFRTGGVGRTLLFGTTLLLVLSPWIGYNLQHFNQPFASDNSRQALVTHPDHVLDYYENPHPDTLRTNPTAWLSGSISKRLARLVRGGWEAMTALPLPVLLLFLLAVPRGAVSDGHGRDRWLLLGLIPVLLFPVAISGYGMITRYYALSILLATVAGLTVLAGRWNVASWSAGRVVLVVIVLAGAVVLPNVPDFLERKISPLRPTPFSEPTRPTDLMERMRAALPTEGPLRVMCTDNYFAAKFGQLTGVSTAMRPLSLKGTFAACVRDWELTHVYDPDGWLQGIDQTGLTLEPLREPHLYRLVLRP